MVPQSEMISRVYWWLVCRPNSEWGGSAMVRVFGVFKAQDMGRLGLGVLMAVLV